MLPTNKWLEFEKIWYQKLKTFCTFFCLPIICSSPSEEINFWKICLPFYDLRQIATLQNYKNLWIRTSGQLNQLSLMPFTIRIKMISVSPIIYSSIINLAQKKWKSIGISWDNTINCVAIFCSNAVKMLHFLIESYTYLTSVFICVFLYNNLSFYIHTCAWGGKGVEYPHSNFNIPGDTICSSECILEGISKNFPGPLSEFTCTVMNYIQYK